MYKTKFIRRIVCIVLLLCLFTTSSHALTLFYSDYDNDEWQVKEIKFDKVDTIPNGWYPLKLSSKYLPIDVRWDG